MQNACVSEDVIKKCLNDNECICRVPQQDETVTSTNVARRYRLRNGIRFLVDKTDSVSEDLAKAQAQLAESGSDVLDKTCGASVSEETKLEYQNKLISVCNKIAAISTEKVVTSTASCLVNEVPQTKNTVTVQYNVGLSASNNSAATTDSGSLRNLQDEKAAVTDEDVATITGSNVSLETSTNSSNGVQCPKVPMAIDGTVNYVSSEKFNNCVNVIQKLVDNVDSNYQYLLNAATDSTVGKFGKTIVSSVYPKNNFNPKDYVRTDTSSTAECYFNASGVPVCSTIKGTVNSTFFTNFQTNFDTTYSSKLMEFYNVRFILTNSANAGGDIIIYQKDKNDDGLAILDCIAPDGSEAATVSSRTKCATALIEIDANSEGVDTTKKETLNLPTDCGYDMNQECKDKIGEKKQVVSNIGNVANEDVCRNCQNTDESIDESTEIALILEQLVSEKGPNNLSSMRKACLDECSTTSRRFRRILNSKTLRTSNSADAQLAEISASVSGNLANLISVNGSTETSLASNDAALEKIYLQQEEEGIFASSKYVSFSFVILTFLLLVF